MKTLFLLAVWISSTLAATTSARQEDVVELIKNLQRKYDSQLEDYGSRLASYEAKIEQYERQVYEYESKLDAHESRIKELEERLVDTRNEVDDSDQRTDEVTEEASVDHEEGSIEQTAVTKVKPKKDTFGRSRRLVLTDAEMPVAFYAQLTKDATGVGNYQTIVFDLVTTNVGNAYNKVDGIFTAPVNGVYAFIWTASNNDNTHMQTELVANAVVVGRQWSDSGNHADISSATGSAVLKLNASDTVWVRSNTIHSRVLMGSQLSSFSGWLLYYM